MKLSTYMSLAAGVELVSTLVHTGSNPAHHKYSGVPKNVYASACPFQNRGFSHWKKIPRFDHFNPIMSFETEDILKKGSLPYNEEPGAAPPLNRTVVLIHRSYKVSKRKYPGHPVKEVSLSIFITLGQNEQTLIFTWICGFIGSFYIYKLKFFF